MNVHLTKEESQGCKSTDDLIFIEKIADNLKVLTGARKTMPSARKSNLESERKNSRLSNTSKMSKEINTQSMYVSDSLNTGLYLLTSTSNSTMPSVSRNKSPTADTKTQNVVSSEEQIESEISLESTYQKTAIGLMSSRTKTNLLENGKKHDRKRSLLNSDFQNIFPRKVSAQNFPQPVNYENVSKTNTKNNFSMTGEQHEPVPTLSNEKEEFSKVRSLSDESEKNREVSSRSLEDAKNPKKFNDPDSILTENGSRRNIQLSRRKQEKPHKSVRFMDKENQNLEAVNKMSFYSDSSNQNRPVTNIPCANQMQRRPLPRILIKRNIKPHYSPNHASSSASGTMQVNNICNLNSQNSSLLYLTGSNLRNSQEVKPVLCTIPIVQNASKNASASPNYSFQRPVPYRKVGTATRGNETCLGRYRLIFPQQVRIRYDATTGIENTNAPGFVIADSAGPRCNVQMNQTPLKVSNNFELVNTSKHTGNRTRAETQPNARNIARNSGRSRIKPLILKPPEITSQPAVPIQSTSNKNDVAAAESLNKKQPANMGAHKILETKMALTKISELLHNISESLSHEFECPTGLQLSLPIWQSELDQCILAAKRIKSVISEYEKKRDNSCISNV